MPPVPASRSYALPHRVTLAELAALAVLVLGSFLV
jgi:hypothetical protein